MKHGQLAAAVALALSASTAFAEQDLDRGPHWAKHIVVIYQENHSFDNLYGLWEPVNGQAVNGLRNAPAAKTRQIAQGGGTYECLLQDDPHLTSPTPLPATCTNTTGASFASAFTNAPFEIDGFIPDTSPTRDLVHRYYQEQYQLNGGQQNRYVTGSDAVGLSMGYYNVRTLPVYQYLHSPGAPSYIVLDNFFQGAFGGSFLNHQWLVAARTPLFAGAVNDGSSKDLHSVVDANGMPTNYPLYASPLGKQALDKALTASCTPPAGRPATPGGTVCGDFAVNTIQPFAQPFFPGTPDTSRLPLLKTPTIGDRLSDAGIDWAWYSGGWSNAAGNVGAPGWTNGTAAPCSDPNVIAGAVWPNCPDNLFQFHHQAFNYYDRYKPGTDARAQHLRDEAEFIAAAKAGTLPAVSFVKPIGEENEHPGYTDVARGSQHLRELLEAIDAGPHAAQTLVLITYDEFGGAWDHVPPPGQGGAPGPHDVFGPGTRIPALLVSRHFERSGVDRTQYDTTSVLAAIERRFGLTPVGEVYGADDDARPRDARVNDFLRPRTEREDRD